MPPKKRFAENFKVGLGYLEIFLLERLQSVAGGSQSDHIRLAILNYARHHPALGPEYLEEAAKNFVKQILEKSRVRPNGQGQHDYYPLTEEAVVKIVSHLRQITPRDVVNTMQQVLEEIRLAGVDPRNGAVTSDDLDEKDILAFIFDN